MATCKQSARRKIKVLKPGPKYAHPTLSRTSILKRCPQVKGIVTRVVTHSKGVTKANVVTTLVTTVVVLQCA